MTKARGALLVAENRRLEAEVERLRQEVATERVRADSADSEIAVLRAEVERLRSCVRQEQNLSNTMSGEIRELQAEVARLRGWKNRALYAETRMTTDGDHIAELDAEVERQREERDHAPHPPCGCREQCGDLAEEDDDPRAQCKGLPR